MEEIVEKGREGELSREWAEADEISDRIIEVLNERVPMVAAEQALVGILLALLGFLRTAEGISNLPVSFVELGRWASEVVREMVARGPQKDREREQ